MTRELLQQAHELGFMRGAEWAERADLLTDTTSPAYLRERDYDIAAIALPVPPAPWQPLKTAPKDGTEIILMRGDRVTAGHYSDEVEVLGSEYHSNGEYLGQYPTGEVHEASWLSWDGGFTKAEPPIYWQHLPSAANIAQPVPQEEPATCKLGCISTETCKAVRDGCSSECVAKPFQMRSHTVRSLKPIAQPVQPADPLTDKEIMKLYDGDDFGSSHDVSLLEFARAIEKAHKIGAQE